MIQKRMSVGGEVEVVHCVEEVGRIIFVLDIADVHEVEDGVDCDVVVDWFAEHFTGCHGEAQLWCKISNQIHTMDFIQSRQLLRGICLS